ncbi:tRNA pseudouridine(55) synthase TruB [Motiliproteus sp. MSK22-1]|uniref:tRNA pseudouridine(55) synthase TruB n=1 Tax=Motiliproteus sp. MSK22-1 TaxID=1897630 RepID=UPI000978C40E|nr:tRNA pseudouridine(55) synthase TruB [Motiliproteus sp. MSK22-1]OMH39080.1 tRNA pseudouridine(55) synthase TruB [Motiliproteus sp. MSK22-1]
MARRRKGRNVDGVLLLDKPAGVSSNYILQKMKRLYGAAKAGHTGALDPLATGMLPICFGEATKFSQFLLDADKHYQTTAKLGIKTASGDAEGDVLEQRPVEGVTSEKVCQLLAEHFDGEITQTPSMYSALKHQGQPLYKLARKGIEVEVKKRQVIIYNIELLDVRGDELDLDIHCSKGTYVRSIVEDLGELLGCGAHVSVLRRLDSGPYKAVMMKTPEQIQEIADLAEGKQESAGENQVVQRALDELLLPAWTAVEYLPVLTIDDQQVEFVKNGRKLRLTDAQLEQVQSAADLVRIVAESEGTFLGLGEVSKDGVLIPRRLMKTQ